MSTAMYARIVFAVSTVLFGGLSLNWHDAETWQTPYKILTLPGGAVIGDILMIALIIGAVGILFDAFARTASIVVIVVEALFCLAAIPGIIAAPKTYAEYGSFFEQFSLLCGGIAVYASTLSDAVRSQAAGRLARVGLGLCAISFTLAQLFYLKFTESLVPTWILPGQIFWTIFTTIAFALAATAMLTNLMARLATSLMALMLALFGILIWVPALVSQPGSHGNWSEFALNFQITGAAWLVAALKSS